MRRHNPLAAVVLSAACLVPIASAEQPHPLTLVDAADVDRAAGLYREEPDAHPVLKQAVALADAVMTAPLRSVTDKKHAPPGGDTHDYWSIAPYWWPDPAAEDGLPWIRRDGQVNPDTRSPDFTDLRRFQHACGDAVDLAVAFKLTGNEAYAERASLVLRTWFLEEETAMNPNLDYAQGIPGRNDGRPAGLIESVGLIPVTDAARLLRASNAWTAGDDAALRRWFGDFLDWMNTSEIGREESTRTNNHGSWYAAQRLAFSLYADPGSVRPDAVRDTFTALIEQQITQEGRQPHELTRTKTLSYSTMNLRAFGTFATLAESVGLDLWHADPRLEAAFGYILPGVVDLDRWPHEQINTPDASSARVAMLMAHQAFGDASYRRAADDEADPTHPTLYDVAAVGNAAGEGSGGGKG